MKVLVLGINGFIGHHLSKLLIETTPWEIYRMDVQSNRLGDVLGPINKPRWIYACAKQLMDRVIAAYGQQQGLQYTLFRPFNFIGTGLGMDPLALGSGEAGREIQGPMAQVILGGRVSSTVLNLLLLPPLLLAYRHRHWG